MQYGKEMRGNFDVGEKGIDEVERLCTTGITFLENEGATVTFPLRLPHVSQTEKDDMGMGRRVDVPLKLYGAPWDAWMTNPDITPKLVPGHHAEADAWMTNPDITPGEESYDKDGAKDV